MPKTNPAALLGALLDAYAAIDELLDSFMADAEPSREERAKQRESNRTRDRVQRALALLPVVVKLVETRIEVAAPRKGKPGYRWTTGYYVCNPETGARECPPVRRAEAYARARELGGAKCRVEIRQDANDARG